MTSDVRPHWVLDDSPIPDPLGYGQRALTFLDKLRHPKSAEPKNAFRLNRWQRRIIQRVYGDVDQDGRRKLKTIFLRVARGNRKSTLAAALGLLHTVGPERVTGGLGVVAALDRAQAEITYREACNIVTMSPTLTRATERREAPIFRLSHPKSLSTFEAISSDGDAKLGRTPTLVITDEVGQWQGRKLWTALVTGLSKAPNSIHWITLTAFAGQQDLPVELERYARAVASGEISDTSFLPLIFETPEDFDWKDEKGWHYANPGLEYGYPDINGLRSMVRQAEHVPAARRDFEVFHLNRVKDVALSPWLDMSIYDRGGQEPVDLSEFHGRKAWIGLDYSLVSDMTFVSVVIPEDDGTYIVGGWGFLPEENIVRKEEQDRVPYREWVDDGYLILTSGNVIDKRVIADKLRELAEEFDVQEISADPYKVRDMLAELAEEGLPTAEFRQGWVSMSPAIETVQEIILGNRMRHFGHPILRRHFAAVVTKQDAAGNQSFHKGKSIGKIDAAVSVTMALQRASQGATGLSVYAAEERGIIFV